MKKRLYFVIILILLILSLQLIFERYKNKDINEDFLYFPKGSNIIFVVSGYNNLIADLLWIRGAVYYGEEKQTHGKFEYLFHIYDIITSLDERFLNAYIFGAFFINYQLKNLKLAIKLIDKGIVRFPDEWVLYFYKGFIYYISYDFDNAYKNFIIGSKFEKGSERCKNFAFMSLLKEKGVKELLYHWTDVYEKSKSPYIKEIAIDGIKEVIKHSIVRFKKEKNKEPLDITELLKEGFIPFIPKLEGRSFRIENGDVIW